MSTHTCILYTLHRHGGEGSYLNFCMELPRELFHSKHFSNGIRWPIFLILSTRVRYKKKNTLISDREKQTIFRRFSTTIPFFFFLRKGKISKNSRNKRYRFSSPPLPVRQNRECVYFALTPHFSLSLFFFQAESNDTSLRIFQTIYIPSATVERNEGRKAGENSRGKNIGERIEAARESVSRGNSCSRSSYRTFRRAIVLLAPSTILSFLQRHVTGGGGEGRRSKVADSVCGAR